MDVPPGLFQHFHHLGLENVIYGLDGDSGPGLRHGEHVDDLDSVLVHKLAEHKTHNFHRYTSTTVLEHFEQSEGRDVDHFTT
jgi:hypothetical protein